MRRRRRAPLAGLALLGLLGCTERATSLPVADAGAPPPPVVVAPVDAGSPLELLERDVAALVSQRCTPCHAWTTRALVYTRSACGARDALVVPFDAEASPLYLKLAGPPRCGAMMPPTGRLPPGATEAVRAWIAAGAPVGGRISQPLPPEKPASTLDWEPAPN